MQQVPDIRMKWPFSSIIAGSSFSGKTHLLFKIIKNIESVMNTSPDIIFYCYNLFQPIFNDFPQVTFVQGADNEKTSESNLKKLSQQGIKVYLIYDDCTPNGNFLKELYTVLSHHLNLSVTILVQNLFCKDIKELRTVSLNCHYTIFLCSPRAVDSVRHFARQVFAENYPMFMEVYDCIVNKQLFGYLFVDCHPQSLSYLKLRSKIFDEEGPTEIFLPLNEKIC